MTTLQQERAQGLIREWSLACVLAGLYLHAQDRMNKRDNESAYYYLGFIDALWSVAQVFDMEGHMKQKVEVMGDGNFWREESS